MAKPQLWMLVGANGSGKSTFYMKYLKGLGLPFINADLIEKDFFPNENQSKNQSKNQSNSYQAARVAEKIRFEQLEQANSFCFETVFSHPSKIDFIGKAKALGYEIVMVFMHLNDPGLNKARVSHRVSQMGHDVPEDKIESRIPRVLNNVRLAIPLCDQVRVLDNSSYENPFRTIAVVKDNTTFHCEYPCPEWLLEILPK
jgi:predicted ABC-type ATPase